MATDRESTFTVGFDGSSGDLDKTLDQIRARFKTVVTEIEATTNKVELFKNTKGKADEAAKSFKTLTDEAAAFRKQIAEIESKGGKAGDQLTASLKATEKALVGATREVNRQTEALKKQEAALAKAGVDVKNLATEEIRLATAAKQAAAAQQDVAARTALGIKSFKETQQEISRLTNAYNTLRTNGTSSVQEITRAKTALNTKLRELQQETNGAGTSLAGLQTRLLGIAASFVVVTNAVLAAVKANQDYQESVAQIGTVTNLTSEEVKQLGEGVKGLAQTLGFDVQDGLRAVYDLLRQGVPAGNVLEVLAQSDAAAKAALTDIGTAAKLSGVLIRGFGVDAKNLQTELDGLFVLMQNGGATFEELAAGLGEIGPVAKAANVPVREIAAAVQVMTRAGLEAPQALGEVNRILIKLSSKETIKNLGELGIEVKGFAGTIAQIADRGLALDEILELGLSSKKAAAGVAALTADSRKLATALDLVDGSAGTIERISADLDKLRIESLQRFGASVKNLAISLGETVTPGNQSLDTMSSLIQTIEGGVSKVNQLDGGFARIAATTALWPLAIVQAATSLIGLNARMAQTAVQQEQFRTELETTRAAAVAGVTAVAAALGQIDTAISGQILASDTAIKGLRSTLQALLPELAASGKAVQQASSEAINAINVDTAARVAALDKLTATETENAKTLTAIQKAAADERLKVLSKFSTDAIALANLEAASRRALAGNTKAAIEKVDQEIAQSKKATLQTIVNAYQAHLNELVAKETAHLNKIKELNDQRANLNQSVEDRIRGIRREGLTEYQQYGDKVREVDENISKARQALVAGDLAAAEKFANKAIELTSGITQKVEEGGATVVSQFSAQETAIGKIKTAQQILNGVLDERVSSEKAAAEATGKNLETSTTQLTKFKEELQNVNTIIGEGIDLKLKIDSEKVITSLNALEEQIKEKEVLVGLRTDLEQVTALAATIKEKLEQGLTAEAKADITQVEAAIAQITAARPELTVQTAAAEAAVGALNTAVEKLGTPVEIEATVNSNASDVQAQIDALKAPTSSTHTIFVNTVEQKAGGGLVGEHTPARRLFSPESRQAVQRFAAGGSVFQRRAWSKVPGAGNKDTVPAALQAGSFVIKKSASQYYGDGLLGALAGVRKFATGGSVSPLLGGKSKTPLLAIESILRNLGGAGGGGNRNVEGVDYLGLSSKLVEIVAAARVLPHSNTGLNMDQWAGALLNKLPYMAPDKLKLVSTLINDSFKGIMLGIENALNFRVPLVVEQGLLGYLFQRGGGGKAAQGTDTIPAMLTPGEWVIKRPAVEKYGQGLMHAINHMMLPRERLAGMLRGPVAPQVQRFAEGGPVGGVQASASGASGSSGGAVTINVTAAAGALLTRENVERLVVPVVRDAMRRAQGR